MRKSGWAAAAGLGSLVLLLTACGSSSSTTAASTQSPASAPQSSAASSSSTSQPATSSPASTPATAPSSGRPTTGTHSHTPQPQPSSGLGDTIPAGTTVMIVKKTKLGYVLAMANGQVVYTYAHDTKGGTPTCTGSCASIWLPVTGVPMVASGEHIPGTFGLVTRSDGSKQMTYNGYPLYRFKGATPFETHVIPGMWAVVQLSAADL